MATVVAGESTGYPSGARLVAIVAVVVAAALVYLGARTFDLPLPSVISGAPDMPVAPPVSTTAGPAHGATDLQAPCAAELALRSGDYAAAYTGFSRRSGSDPSAAFHLGAMYRDGLGIARNEELAVRAFAQAADGGHREAMTALARIFGEGNGPLSNYAEALAWYEKAALLGDADAQAALARMYADGRGAAQDTVTAAAWLDVAVRVYADAGKAVPLPVSTLRADVNDHIDNNKKTAAATAAAELMRRVAVGQAQYRGVDTSCGT